jgi:hypothetical protein
MTDFDVRISQAGGHFCMSSTWLGVVDYQPNIGYTVLTRSNGRLMEKTNHSLHYFSGILDE